LTPPDRSWIWLDCEKNSKLFATISPVEGGREQIAIFDEHLAVSRKTIQDISCVTTRIRTRMQSIEWCHFEWRWMTLTQLSRVCYYSTLYIPETVQDRDMLTMQH